MLAFSCVPSWHVVNTGLIIMLAFLPLLLGELGVDCV